MGFVVVFTALYSKQTNAIPPVGNHLYALLTHLHAYCQAGCAKVLVPNCDCRFACKQIVMPS